MKRKEFIEKYADPSIRKEIKSAAILGYIFASISVILGPLLFDTGLSTGLIIQFLVTLGLVLGFHIGKSKACAIIYLVLACVDSLCGLIVYGRLTGWLILIVGINVVRIFHKADKELKKLNESFDSPEI